MPLAEDDLKPDKVFRKVANRWLEVIKAADRHKEEVFGCHAAELQQFLTGPKDWRELMGAGYVGDGEENEGGPPSPTFTISVNKAFEYVSIFGPALYYENPVRTVRPRMPVDVPVDFLIAAGVDQAGYAEILEEEQARVRIDGLRAVLIGAYVNWTPREFKLDVHSRDAINEALVKGMSCLWSELDSPPGTGFTAARSTFDSVDNFLIDPDATSLDDAAWIAKRCVHPTWQVERLYDIPEGKVKSNAESLATAGHAAANEAGRENRQKGKSNDLLVYYKVWSKMGMGGRLPNMPKEYRQALEVFGDYCYVVVAENMEYPLNLSPWFLREAIFEPGEEYKAAEWPTPFWAAGGWPVETLAFTRVAGCPWGYANLRAGLGELRFLNWAFSFLAGHISVTLRDFIVMLKSLPESVKTAVLHGVDLEVIEIESTENKTIDQLVSFLQHPQMNKDIWPIIEAVANNFDKRVGLTDLMYGQSGSVQIRSAEEASVKQQNMSVRPEDMAKQVETWQAGAAAKEAFSARYHLSNEDVLPVLGRIGAFAWSQFCSSKDLVTSPRQLEYQIESGSTQKPNKNFEVRQMDAAFQSLSPIFMNYATTYGDLTPINNLLSDYAKSRDLDPARYQLSAMIPPQPPAAQVGGPEAAQQEPTENSPQF